MTDAAFDRRLRGWLEDREPGPVPSTLRADIARVPIETPIPAASRAWQAVVGSARRGQPGSPVRLMFVLVVLGLLVAAIAAVLAVGSRPTPLTAWRDYVLGQPAPDLEFGSVAGSLTGGDPTISVDDLREFEFVVVLYFPGDATADRTAVDARKLVEASEHALPPTAFLVIAPAASPIASETVDRIHAAGMLTAEPPADWPAASQPQGEPVLVITDRRGDVAYLYVGDLPEADLLVGDLDRASVQ
jgi:hypothetical protein